jgi:hypothetical protein
MAAAIINTYRKSPNHTDNQPITLHHLRLSVIVIEKEMSKCSSNVKVKNGAVSMPFKK